MATSVAHENLYGLLLRHCKSALSTDFAGKVAQTYLARILVTGIGLATAVIVARMLGPEGRGYYAVAAATGALGVQFGNLGLHVANAYFAAKQPSSLPFLIGNSWAVSFGGGGLIAFVLAGLLAWRPGWLDIHGVTLLLALLWIPFGLAYMLIQYLMLGIQDIRGYNWAEIGSKVIPLALISLLVLTRQSGVASFFSATVVGMAAACIWLGLRLHKVVPVRPRLSLLTFRSSVQIALRAYLLMTFGFLVLRADLFMVQRMLGAEQAGYYSIASTMADYVTVIATVIGTLLFPKLSALTDLHEKLHLTRKATIGTFLVLVPFLALAAVLARPVVRILFGTAFLPAALCFVLLLPGMLFLGIHSVAVQFLNSIGYPLSVVVIWGLSCLLNISVDLWAIPHYGIAGASVVSSVSYFLAFFFVMLVLYRTSRGICKAVA